MSSLYQCKIINKPPPQHKNKKRNKTKNKETELRSEKEARKRKHATDSNQYTVLSFISLCIPSQHNTQTKTFSFFLFFYLFHFFIAHKHKLFSSCSFLSSHPFTTPKHKSFTCILKYEFYCFYVHGSILSFALFCFFFLFFVFFQIPFHLLCVIVISIQNWF
jgi:hypothetical protein